MCQQPLTHKNFIFSDAQNPREFQDHSVRSMNVKVWCALHARAILEPYYFSKTIFSRDNHRRMMNTFIWSEAQSFLQNGLFLQNRALPEIRGDLDTQ